MKRLIIILFILFPIVGISQSFKKGDFVGKDKHRNISKFLHLDKNGTFSLEYYYDMYSNPLSNMGVYSAIGLWKQVDDTIILNTNLSREDVLNIEENSTIEDSMTFIYDYEWNVHHPIQLRTNHLEQITLHPGDTVKVEKTDLEVIYISFLDLETTFTYKRKDLKTNMIVFSHTSSNGDKLFKLGIIENCKLLLKENTLIPLTNLNAINIKGSYVSNKRKVKKPKIKVLK